MRAVQFSQYGAPSVLQVVDVEVPRVRRGEVRIAVRASSISPGEMLIRSGARRDIMVVKFPFRTGFEATGLIDEIGEGVTGVSVGEEVFGHTDTAARGANADFAVLVAWAAKPAVWSWAEAGAAAGGIETATRVLDRLGVVAGNTVLVQGASGAVGAVAVQLAIARGAHVIGTASERNHALVRCLGAEPTTYGPGLAERIHALAPPTGVDAVFDCAGGALPDLISITGDPARVVTIADPNAASYGVHESHYAADRLASYGLATAATLAGEGRLRIPVAAMFTLDDVVAAAEYTESRHAPGKTVLVT